MEREKKSMIISSLNSHTRALILSLSLLLRHLCASPNSSWKLSMSEKIIRGSVILFLSTKLRMSAELKNSESGEERREGSEGESEREVIAVWDRKREMWKAFSFFFLLEHFLLPSDTLPLGRLLRVSELFEHTHPEWGWCEGHRCKECVHESILWSESNRWDFNWEVWLRSVGFTDGLLLGCGGSALYAEICINFCFVILLSLTYNLSYFSLYRMILLLVF